MGSIIHAMQVDTCTLHAHMWQIFVRIIFADSLHHENYPPVKNTCCMVVPQVTFQLSHLQCSYTELEDDNSFCDKVPGSDCAHFIACLNIVFCFSIGSRVIGCSYGCLMARNRQTSRKQSKEL